MQTCPNIIKLLDLLNIKDKNENSYKNFLNNTNIAIKCTNAKQVRKVLNLNDKSIISGKVAAQLLNYGYVNINKNGHIKSNLDSNITIIPYRSVVFEE